jgi:uncharacterized membrane protein YeaQ/YmgE (transglycosylase-associated protein family)
MNILWTIIIGFVIGLIARALVPGPEKAGIIVTTILGIAGAFVGSWLGHTLGIAAVGDGASFLLAVLGSVLLLLLWRAVAPRLEVV